MTGMTLGTMSYLSPEQATGSELGPASDVYGLGLVLLECATGRPAFTGTMAEVATARLIASPDVPVDLDPRLGDLLARMTRMAPQDRPDAPGGGAGPGGDPGRRVGGDPRAACRREPDAGRRARRSRATTASPASRRGPAPPSRLVPRRSLVAGAVVLLVGGTLLVGQLAGGAGTPVVPPSYPAVEGAVGESLTQLQESVEP